MRGVPERKDGGFFGLWRGVVYFVADANDAVYVATYAFLRPALIANLNVADPLAVFWISVLAGSLGDAVGSVFRVPMEIIYKQVQTGAATGGGEVVTSLAQNKGSVRLIVLSWVAVLCRGADAFIFIHGISNYIIYMFDFTITLDMPFAGLQIALYDVFKSLLSFLDDWGVNVFIQGAVWGALAGSVASFITTPFDVLTTTVMTAAQDEAGSVGGLVADDSADEVSNSDQFVLVDGTVITLDNTNSKTIG